MADKNKKGKNTKAAAPKVGTADTRTTANMIATTAGGTEAKTTTTAAITTMVSAASTTTTTTTPAVATTTAASGAATTSTTATPTTTITATATTVTETAAVTTAAKANRTTTTATDTQTTTPTATVATVATMTPPVTPVPAPPSPETLTAGEPEEDAHVDAEQVPVLIMLLGEELLGKKKTIQMSSLCTKDKYIGLYFSAHWCPPCRAFTPQLVDFYKKFKSSPRGDQLEIIFVSFDRSEDNFKSYFAEMPWLAVPYDEQEIRESAGATFSVSGIPSLIFVKGSTGELVQKDGRSKVSSDPNGSGFPWG